MVDEQVPDDGTDYGDYTSKWEYLGKGLCPLSVPTVSVLIHFTMDGFFFLEKGRVLCDHEENIIFLVAFFSF